MAETRKGTLALTRRAGEKVLIGPDIVVTVAGFGGGKVRLLIEAPTDVSVDREEVRRSKLKVFDPDEEAK